LSHGFALTDRLLYSSRMFEKNHKFVLKGMTVEVLELDKNGLPKELAFTFDARLEDRKYQWLQFDSYSFRYKPFHLPRPGETVLVDGPPYFSFGDSMRFLLSGRKNR
jgi:hypothetical protein